MSNPYEFEMNGLRVVVYAENKSKATAIFNQKIESYNKEIYNQALKDVLKLTATLGIDWEVKNGDIEWLEKSIQDLRR